MSEVLSISGAVIYRVPLDVFSLTYCFSQLLGELRFVCCSSAAAVTAAAKSENILEEIFERFRLTLRKCPLMHSTWFLLCPTGRCLGSDDSSVFYICW